MKKSKKSLFYQAFLVTIPVLLGYLTIGFAFGLLLNKAGYSWYIAMLMSILIYAGAGQYIAVGLFTSNASFFEIATVILLVNSRHMVYGLSLFKKFLNTGWMKPYLIFALTDETYGLLTTIEIPVGINTKHYYFTISILNQSYWIFGSFFGALIGDFLTVDTAGLDFALTALFVVLLIEQFKACKAKLPFLIALCCGLPAAFFLQKNSMLLIAILLSILVLIFFRKRIQINAAD